MGTVILHSIVLCIPSLMEKKLHKKHREARGHRIYKSKNRLLQESVCHAHLQQTNDSLNLKYELD